jgi:5,10-methylenetetrahydromethanopterin reductase
LTVAMPRARIGLSVPPQLPPADIPAYARRAESAGFDELWLAEDCFFAGGIAAASAALSSTHRLVVGLGIMPAVPAMPHSRRWRSPQWPSCIPPG